MLADTMLATERTYISDTKTAQGYLYRHIREGFIKDWFFPVLLFLAPIQSFLLLSIQGTTPAFLLVLSSGILLFSNDVRYYKIVAFYILFWLCYFIFLAISLYGYKIDYPDMTQLNVIRQVYIFGDLKQTNITQGLYIFVALLFCFVVYQYYQESFLRYAFYGIIALSFYGFYEFIYFAITHQNGDFISNRNFGNLSDAAGGIGQGDFVTGSMLQPSTLFGPDFMRLKSLVGEPSMYALTVTPFAVYAYARRWWLIFGLLFISLVLSTSSTAVIGLVVGIVYIEFRLHQEAVVYAAIALIFGALLYFTVSPVTELFNKLVFYKLSTYSGNQRMQMFFAHAAVPFDGNPIRAFFGLGFGTVRSTDMLSNLLANVGILGLLGYSAAILGPCFLLRKGSDTGAIIAALGSIFAMEMLTVSEFAYLPPWFMVALGYARARQQRTPLLSHSAG